MISSSRASIGHEPFPVLERNEIHFTVTGVSEVSHDFTLHALYAAERGVIQ